MALASAIEFNAVNLLGGKGPASWERWWREKGNKATIQEEHNPGGGAHWCTWGTVAFWKADPFWGAEREGFEQMKLKQVARLVKSLREPPILAEGQIQQLEALTDVHLEVASWGEPLSMTPLIEAWERWYRENADRLRWDWGKGHLVVASRH
jgi:hypothetical protein